MTVIFKAEILLAVDMKNVNKLNLRSAACI